MALFLFGFSFRLDGCRAVGGGACALMLPNFGRWSLSSFPGSFPSWLAILEEVKRAGKAEEGKKGKRQAKKGKEKTGAIAPAVFWCLIRGCILSRFPPH